MCERRMRGRREEGIDGKFASFKADYNDGLQRIFYFTSRVFCALCTGPLSRWRRRFLTSDISWDVVGLSLELFREVSSQPRNGTSRVSSINQPLFMKISILKDYSPNVSTEHRRIWDTVNLNAATFALERNELFE